MGLRARKLVRDPVSGSHQGQRHRPREQAGHMSCTRPQADAEINPCHKGVVHTCPRFPARAHTPPHLSATDRTRERAGFKGVGRACRIPRAMSARPEELCRRGQEPRSTRAQWMRPGMVDPGSEKGAHPRRMRWGGASRIQPLPKARLCRPASCSYLRAHRAAGPIAHANCVPPPLRCPQARRRGLAKQAGDKPGANDARWFPPGGGS